MTAMAAAPRLETQASAYWLAASAMRGRGRISRITAIRELIHIVKHVRHAAMRQDAARALGNASYLQAVAAGIAEAAGAPPAGVRLFDDWPPNGGDAA